MAKEIEIEIPKDYEAKIVGNKVVLEQKESEDEKKLRAVLEYIKDDALRSWLDKLKEQKPFSQEAFNAAKHEDLWEEHKPAELSEDERIRKELIDYFRDPSETKVVPQAKFREWYDWLIKQGQ